MTPEAASSRAHRQLLLDDVQQSLTGLLVSLAQDSAGLAQAGLHARDLSHALHLAGLAPVAPLIETLGERLAKGEDSALFLGRGLAELVGRAIEGARSGQEQTALQEQIEHWQQRLKARQSEVGPAPIDNLSEPTTQALPARTLQAGALHQVGLQRIDELRSQLGAAVLNTKTLDAQLSAFEDWLISQGQYALSDLYPGPKHQVGAAWADSAVTDFLRGSLDWAYRSQSIRASTLRLTLRLDWVGAQLNPLEVQALGHQVSALDGRLQALPEGGWRLWLPACRKRMWLQTFSRAGQNFALSAALLESPPEPGDRSLRLRTGHAEGLMSMDAAGHQAAMNLYPIPPSVPMPPDVIAVAVDPSGGLFPVLRICLGGLA